VTRLLLQSLNVFDRCAALDAESGMLTEERSVADWESDPMAPSLVSGRYGYSKRFFCAFWVSPSQTAWVRFGECSIPLCEGLTASLRRSPLRGRRLTLLNNGDVVLDGTVPAVRRPMHHRLDAAPWYDEAEFDPLPRVVSVVNDGGATIRNVFPFPLAEALRTR